MRGGWRGLLSHVKRLDTKDRVTKRDVEDVLRACQAIGRQEGAMEDVIYHMCTAVNRHPSLITVISTVFGILNASGEGAGKQMLELLAPLVERKLDSRPESMTTLQQLRLLVDLENTCVVDPESTVIILTHLVRRIQDTARTITQRCTYALLLAGCLPWVGRDLSERQPQQLDAICDALQSFLGELEDETGVATHVSTQLYQVLAMRERQWEDHAITRHYIHFVPLFEKGKQHPLPAGVFGATATTTTTTTSHGGGSEGNREGGDDGRGSRMDRSSDDDDDEDGGESGDERRGERRRSGSSSEDESGGDNGTDDNGGDDDRQRRGSRSRGRRMDGSTDDDEDNEKGSTPAPSRRADDDGGDDQVDEGDGGDEGGLRQHGGVGMVHYGQDDTSDSVLPRAPVYLIDTLPVVPLFPPVATVERYIVAQLALPSICEEASLAAQQLAALSHRLQPLAASFCIMEAIFAQVLCASRQRVLHLQQLMAKLFMEEAEFCDAFVVCLRSLVLKAHVLSMQQVDIVSDCMSMVLCQIGFDLPWKDLLGDPDSISAAQEVLVKNVLESTLCFASSSKLKRKMPETCHFLLPASDTTATTICANARAAPEVQAIITALNATDGSDDDVMAALETWTVASLGFNALSETLTACPQNSLPSAAFWIAILSQEDALEDVLWRCDRWAAVLRRVSKFEASQDAALAVIGAMLSSKFSTIATLTRHLMRERIFSPVSLVKYYTSLPRAFISSRTFPLVQEAVRACQPDAGFSEEVERVLQTVVSKLSQQINTEDSETCAQLLCQRFRSFFDEFVAGCTRQEIQGVMADIDFVSTIPCVTELAQTISSVLEDEDDGDDL